MMNEFIVYNFEISDVVCMKEQLECERKFKHRYYQPILSGRGYSPVFNKHRKEIMQSVPDCFVCRVRKAEHVHHVDKNASNNTIENLIPVCKKCHYEVFHPRIGKLLKRQRERIL